LFHNSNIFGSLIIHILYTACAKIKKKIRRQKVNDLYSSRDTIGVIKPGRMRWSGHVTRMGKRRGAYRVLVGKPEGKRLLGRLRRRWEADIKLYLPEV
jgi:hypothetical protein